MIEEKTCYNCGNKNCHIFYYSVKQDVAEHHETYEYTEFDCVNHDKWEELKVEEIRTDNTETLINALERITELEKENAELKKVAEFQQSSNMSRHFENKKLKEVLAVGSTFNKALNSMNKSLEEERDKYRNMVFDKNDQLTEAKKIIEELYNIIPASMSDYAKEPMEHARKFMTEE